MQKHQVLLFLIPKIRLYYLLYLIEVFSYLKVRQLSLSCFPMVFWLKLAFPTTYFDDPFPVVRLLLEFSLKAFMNDFVMVFPFCTHILFIYLSPKPVSVYQFNKLTVCNRKPGIIRYHKRLFAIRTDCGLSGVSFQPGSDF